MAKPNGTLVSLELMVDQQGQYSILLDVANAGGYEVAGPFRTKREAEQEIRSLRRSVRRSHAVCFKIAKPLAVELMKARR